MSAETERVPVGYSVKDEKEVIEGHKTMVTARHGKLIVEYVDGVVIQVNTDIRKRVR